MLPKQAQGKQYQVQSLKKKQLGINARAYIGNPSFNAQDPK